MGLEGQDEHNCQRALKKKEITHGWGEPRQGRKRLCCSGVRCACRFWVEDVDACSRWSCSADIHAVIGVSDRHGLVGVLWRMGLIVIRGVLGWMAALYGGQNAIKR